jgi:hypothetical protein
MRKGFWSGILQGAYQGLSTVVQYSSELYKASNVFDILILTHYTCLADGC